jgi:hypothetical protein
MEVEISVPTCVSEDEKPARRNLFGIKNFRQMCWKRVTRGEFDADELGAASQARRSSTAEESVTVRIRRHRGESPSPQPADATEPPSTPTRARLCDAGSVIAPRMHLSRREA